MPPVSILHFITEMQKSTVFHMFGEVAINPIKRNLYDKPQLRNTKLAERLREVRAFQG